MVRVMNLQKKSLKEAVDQVSRADVEIQVKEGGTGLHKTIREINLVYKGLIMVSTFCTHGFIEN